MAAKSRRKGKVGENEFAALAREAGFADSKRTAPMQAGGYADEFGDVSDIPLLYAEVKRYARTPIARLAAELLATERPGQTSVLFSRDNHRGWLATIDAREFLNRHKELLDLRAEVVRLRQQARDTLEDDLGRRLA